jgi:hypothetical protein
MFSFCAIASCDTARHVLSAAIMVKNEPDAMRLTLASLGNAAIKSVVVYDTGSTDDTVAVVRGDCEKLGLSLDLFQGDFVDFSTSRNILLERARFTADWLLLLDAGDIIKPEGATEITAVLADDKKHCAMWIEQQWNTSPRHFVNRLIRNDGEWRYKQPVHEYIEHSLPCEIGTSTLKLFQDRSVSGRTSPKRWESDVGLLKKDSDTNPRSAYYLANTYNQLGLWLEAIEAYKHRISMTTGWYEEVEVSHVSLVQAYLQLGNTGSAKEVAFRLYTQYKRIEGLMALARHAIDVQNEPELCVEYTTLACLVPPIERFLFHEPREYSVYRYTLRNYCLSKEAQLEQE